MLTETFINSCFTLIFNTKVKVKKDNALYKDLSGVLNFYDQNETLKIPLATKNKFDCLKKICLMKLQDGKSEETILDSILVSEKYRPLTEFITIKKEENIKDRNVIEIIKQVRLRKKLNSLFTNYDKLDGFVQSVKNGSFEAFDDIVLEYEDIIRTLFSNMMESNRGISLEAASSLDLSKDNYESILETIIRKYQKSNTTSTGFRFLDEFIYNGGYEKSRLYIVAGGSGTGKSTFLHNSIIKSASASRSFIIQDDNNKDQKNVYLYITLENSVDESLVRIYQTMFSKSLQQTLFDISDKRDIKKDIMTKLSETNSTIIIKYFPPQSISCTDIAMQIDDVNEQYGSKCIKGVYIDYLDLLRTDIKYDLYRLELGHITVSLKTLAIEYDIPIITATQLSRASYRVQNANELNNDMMSESIKKVEHADSIILIARDAINDSIVYGRVTKNRNGRANINLQFDVNFSSFNFTTCSAAVTNKNNDETRPQTKVEQRFSTKADVLNNSF